MEKYDPKKIESKWQNYWEEHTEFFAADDDSAKEKKFILDMFPYPSGEGLHVGHVESYTATDIMSRYLRLNGNNVLHPQGWDAFGLPAENYAIKTGTHPKITTQKAIANFKSQMKRMGFSYDWSRELNSSDPEYYKWTQWFFLLLYKNGLAYKAKAKVNWCENCKTVLANEQAEGGICERCKNPVVQKDLEQWFFKITDFIENNGTTSGLISGLDKVDWPESTKMAQKNWIGKSGGATIKFSISNSQFPSDQNSELFIEVFTTRLDTIFGCTYCVVAPEHGLIYELKDTIENWEEVNQYLEDTKNKSDLQRIEEREKTGAELKGVSAVNPFTGEKIPVFVADYVLGSYGTGAVMGVPAHDMRDLEFAEKYNLPVRPVVFKQENKSRSFVMGVDEERLKGIGISILEKTDEGSFKILIPPEKLEDYKVFIKEALRPGFWNEFSTPDGFYFIFKHKDGRIEEMNLNEKTNDLIDTYGSTFNGGKAPKNPDNVYSWHSWISKDHFYHDLLIHTEDGVLVNSKQFSGLKSEEAREKLTEWLKERNMGERRVNYRIRDWLVSRQRYWGAPIPIIYCEQCGMVPVPEKDLPVILPDDVDFKPTGESPLVYSKKFHDAVCPQCGKKARRESDTMDTFVCSSWYYFRYADPKNSEAFADKEKIQKWLPVDLYVGGAEHSVLHLLYSRFFTKVLHKLGYIDFDEPFSRMRHQGIIIAEDGRKMSKSLGNVINPDDVVAEYGADTLRLFEMFMGPLEDMKPWNTKSIMGSRRFLERVWMVLGEYIEKFNKGLLEDVPEKSRLIHKTVKKITEDIEKLRLNTAISSLMVYLNERDFVNEEKEIDMEAIKKYIILLYPFAPHIASELFSQIEKGGNITSESWPMYDSSIITEEEVELIIQINGKLRDRVSARPDISEEEAKKLALSSEKIKKFLAGKEVRRVIFVGGRLINIVV